MCRRTSKIYPCNKDSSGIGPEGGRGRGKVRARASMPTRNGKEDLPRERNHKREEGKKSVKRKKRGESHANSERQSDRGSKEGK